MFLQNSGRDTLHDGQFVDKTPQEVYAALLDGGSYLCSVRTMYRILEACNEVKERRNQLRHPVYAKPELLAEGPNQVWSWDITKLKGAGKVDVPLPLCHHRYLQLVRCGLDGSIQGTGELWRRNLIEGSCKKQGIQSSQLKHPFRSGAQYDIKTGRFPAC